MGRVEGIRLGAGLAASLAILGLFAHPLFIGQFHTYDDLLNFHLPLRAFYAGRLAEGRAFDWCPGLFGGFYLQGEGQLGMYHPLHLILYRLLPLHVAFMLELILSYPFTQVGTYLFLRRRGLGRDSSTFGSLVFTFSSYMMLRFAHLNAVATLAHMPWLLWAIDRFVHAVGRSRVPAGLAVMALTTSQLLLGHPQFSFYSILVEGLYAIWIAVPLGGMRYLPQLTGLKLLGVATAGLQLLPILDQLMHSVRYRPTTPTAFDQPAMLVNLAQWFAPYMFRARVIMPEAPTKFSHYTHEASLYCGSVIPVLLCWLATRRRDLGPLRRPAVAAIALACLGLTLTFVNATPLSTIFSRLPLFNMFRINIRYYVMFQLAMAVLGAIAMADLATLVGRDERTTSRRIWPLALPALVATILVPAAWLVTVVRPSVRNHVSPASLVLAGPILSLAAGLLVAIAARGRAWALPTLILFAAADLGAYDLSFVFHSPKADMASVVDSLPDPPPGPGYRLAPPFVNWKWEDRLLLLKDARLVGGYVALFPVKAIDWVGDVKGRRIAGVGHAMVGDESRRFLRWESCPDPLPRARLVTRTMMSRTIADDLADIDPAAVALVPIEIDLPAGAVPGRARIVDDLVDLIRVETSASSQQFLILAESHHEGWKVSVDGQAQPVIPAYGDFLGCIVPPGDHRLEFQFRPRSLRLGLWLSALGGACTAVLLTLWYVLAPPDRGPSGATRTTR